MTRSGCHRGASSREARLQCCTPGWISVDGMLVHDTLEREGWDVEIADAQKVKGLAPLACKTDKIDSMVLAVLSRRDLVPAIWLPDPRVREERELARFRMRLVKHKSALRTESIPRRSTSAGPCPVTDLFGAEGRRLLARLDRARRQGPRRDFDPAGASCGTGSRTSAHSRPRRDGRVACPAPRDVQQRRPCASRHPPGNRSSELPRPREQPRRSRTCGFAGSCPRTTRTPIRAERRPRHRCPFRRR